MKNVILTILCLAFWQAFAYTITIDSTDADSFIGPDAASYAGKMNIYKGDSLIGPALFFERKIKEKGKGDFFIDDCRDKDLAELKAKKDCHFVFPFDFAWNVMNFKTNRECWINYCNPKKTIDDMEVAILQWMVKHMEIEGQTIIYKKFLKAFPGAKVIRKGEYNLLIDTN